MNGRSESFEKYLPRLHKEKYNPCEKTTVLKENDKYLSCASYISYNVHVLNNKYKLGAIGNVATHPNESNKGYMKQVMYSIINEAKENNVDVITLQGMRERYKNYNFDRTGYNHSFSLNIDELNKYLTKNKVKTLKLKSIYVNSDMIEEIDNAYYLYKTLSHRASRQHNEFYDITNGMHSKLINIYSVKRFVGYAVYSLKENKISELTLINERYLYSALISISKLISNTEFDVVLPPYKTKYIKELLKASVDHNMDTNANFLVFNFEKIIRLYLEFKATYTNLDSTDFIMEIVGIKYREILHIKTINNKVYVEQSDEKPHFKLTYFEALEFLFGMTSILRDENPYVKNLFPIHLNVLDIDNI